MKTIKILLFVFFSLQVSGAELKHAAHCDTSLLQVKRLNGNKGRLIAEGRQHIHFSFVRFPTHSTDFLNLKDHLHVYQKNGNWYAPGDRLSFKVLPAFTKDQSFQSHLVFENNGLPKDAYKAGDYIQLTKRTSTSDGKEHQYIRAIAYRGNVAIAAAHVSLSEDSRHNAAYAHTPQFAARAVERDQRVAVHKQNLDSGVISQDEFRKLKSKEYRQMYEKHGVGNYTTLRINCSLYK